MGLLTQVNQRAPNIPHGDFRSEENKLNKPLPYKVGDKVIVTTVTLYWVGRVATIYDDAVTLTSATFIPVIKSLAELYATGFAVDDDSLQCTKTWQMINRDATCTWSPYPPDEELPGERTKTTLEPKPEDQPKPKGPAF